MVVEVRHVVGESVREVGVVEDQYPVEQFWAYGADPSLGDRVRPRVLALVCAGCGCLRWRTRHEGVVNLLPCLVSDNECEARHAVAEVH
jgi:hypothetical protein